MAATMAEFGLITEPAYCRFKMSYHSVNKESLRAGKSTLLKLLNIEELHQFLQRESSLLQSLIRLRTGQLRKEKSIQFLKRVNACLRRVKLMDKLFSYGADVIQDFNMFVPGKDHVYLPCRQSLTFVLYLVYQYHELLSSTISYTVTAFQHFTCLCTTGHLLKLIVTFMASLARIWQVCRVLKYKLGDCYNGLYLTQQTLQAAVSDWKWPDLPKSIVVESVSPTSHEDASSQENDIAKYASQEIEKSQHSIDVIVSSCTAQQVSGFDATEDLGVPVNMEEYQTAVKRKLEGPTMAEDSPKRKKKKIVADNTSSKKTKACLLNSTTNDNYESTILKENEPSIKGKKKRKIFMHEEIEDELHSSQNVREKEEENDNRTKLNSSKIINVDKEKKKSKKKKKKMVQNNYNDNSGTGIQDIGKIRNVSVTNSGVDIAERIGVSCKGLEEDSEKISKPTKESTNNDNNVFSSTTPNMSSDVEKKMKKKKKKAESGGNTNTASGVEIENGNKKGKKLKKKRKKINFKVK